jgi:hypothetical protein
MAQNPIQLVALTSPEIRKLFNEGGYLAKLDSGELSEKLVREGHPSPAKSGEPHCTRSQIVAYLDANGRQVALVHQYARKDGSIGGSGKPDPKKLFHEGTLYVVR